MKQFDQFLLDKIKEEKLNRKRLQEKGDRAKAPRFDQIAAALDEYYFVNQLQLYCAYLSYSKMVNPELLGYSRDAFKMIDGIIKVIEAGETTNPFIDIYNQIRILFEGVADEEREDTQQYFDEILSLIRSNQSEETNAICLDALSLLSNYCIRMANQRQENYIEKMFVINNEIINGLYEDNPRLRKVMPAAMYKNMVVTAFKIKGKDFFKTQI